MMRAQASAGAAGALPHLFAPRKLVRKRPACISLWFAAVRGCARVQLAHSASFPPVQMKMVSVSTVSERLKIGGSLARAALRELVQKGLLRSVSYHSKGAVYTRNTTSE